MYKIAINGFGRIGRNVLRAMYEYQKNDQIKVVAINDLGEAAINAHLLKYDTVHGEFAQDVSVDGDHLVVAGDRIKVLAERDPANLPWAELGVDLVLECTGFFTARDDASAHLTAGASKVLVSAPGKNMDATVVYGVNDDVLTSEHQIVSNASCTTNCLAPIAKALHDAIGIEKGLANTVHSYTNDQRLNDVYHTDLRRARAAAHSMIPSKTGAAAAIGLVVPALAGKLDGLSIRVPTLNVSLLDLTVTLSRDTTVEEVNEILTNAAEASKGGIFRVNTLPLVSSDFNHNPASSIADVTQTRVFGDMVKVLAWYDNEWGFSNRMIDTAARMLELGSGVALSKAS
ncbi:type I glyceraldehyde-3-phosphate dehydrogenase [Arenicella xantha]|uniref:Glyceraldehyde-3-phosphate dehydrogenase n=1 Tax=Arenicella xantha TaxID=644221 RepID=A0A395JHX3_9GAMM|nr:type I glyceraldehyde-3-phosphate dehydrogenase [Arenicella xantha]RBP49740.1 glyceraldehyde-3-phosphate dehydrogenase (NAD+) [Arenicella xantha]